MTKTLGIIGFGRFGQLVTKHLKDNMEISVSDLIDKRKMANEMGVVFTNIEKCASNDIVLLCVPISAFEKVLLQIIPFLKTGSTVLDVCSVKESPVKAMEKYVPKYCNCIGTHPLFGPDSAKDGLNGKKIVICPIRVNQIRKIKNFLTQFGLEIIETNPEEHDKQMAKSLALIHFLGRGLKHVNVQDVEMATPTHEMFVELVNIVQNDSKQLFVDIQQHNRFTRKIRKSLIQELIKIDGEIDGS
jgi:prephenate dehydrogenase